MLFENSDIKRNQFLVYKNGCRSHYVITLRFFRVIGVYFKVKRFSEFVFHCLGYPYSHLTCSSGRVSAMEYDHFKHAIIPPWKFYFLTIDMPHLGQFIWKHGVPAWCGTFVPQEGQMHWPTGPAPLPLPLPLPFPIPLPVPGPDPPGGPVPFPLGIPFTSFRLQTFSSRTSLLSPSSTESLFFFFSLNYPDRLLDLGKYPDEGLEKGS